jgi:hypothetical protein
VLLAVFAGLALILAVAGVYGVLAYTVARRTAEIGVRLALGATHGHVLRRTFVLGMRPVIVGLVIMGWNMLSPSQAISPLLLLIVCPPIDEPWISLLETDGSQEVFKPVSHQWSLNLERQLGRDYAVTLGYLGVRGEHLSRTRDINFLPAVPVLGSFSNGTPVTYLRHPGRANPAA